MTEDDVRYYAGTFSDLERRVVLLCEPRVVNHYRDIMEKTGATRDEIADVSSRFKSMNLVEIKATRMGREFSRSAMFLNVHGEIVRSYMIAHPRRKQRS